MHLDLVYTDRIEGQKGGVNNNPEAPLSSLVAASRVKANDRIQV